MKTVEDSGSQEDWKIVEVRKTGRQQKLGRLEDSRSQEDWKTIEVKQTINHHSVEVRAETSSKIATMAINVPIGDALSSVTNCRSTDQ